MHRVSYCTGSHEKATAQHTAHSRQVEFSIWHFIIMILYFSHIKNNPTCELFYFNCVQIRSESTTKQWRVYIYSNRTHATKIFSEVSERLSVPRPAFAEKSSSYFVPPAHIHQVVDVAHLLAYESLSSRAMTSFSILDGEVVGPYRLMGMPLLSQRNFVKFHLMYEPKSPPSLPFRK